MDPRQQQMIDVMREREMMLEQSKPILCECGNNTFNNVFLLRRVPASISPAGIESILPAPAYECSLCGKLVLETVHPAILEADNNAMKEEEVDNNVEEILTKEPKEGKIVHI